MNFDSRYDAALHPDRRQLVRIAIKSRKELRDLGAAQDWADKQPWSHLCAEIFFGPRFVVFFRRKGA